MSDSVDREDTHSLLAQIQQDAFEFVGLNKRINDFQEELQNKFHLNAQNHQMQLNLRLKLFEELRLLVGVIDSSYSVSRCCIVEDVRGDERVFFGSDDQLQEAEALAEDPDFQLTRLRKLMSQHYERMKGLADAHEQLLFQERELLIQLQTVESNKNNSITRLHIKLEELENDHGQQLQQAHENVKQMMTECAEKEYRLDEAEKKLAESGAKNNELSVELTSCMQQLHSCSVEKSNALALAQLQMQVDEANKKLAEIGGKNNEMNGELANCMQQLQSECIEKSNELAQLQMQLGEAYRKLSECEADNYKLTEKLKQCKTKLRTGRELASLTKVRQLRELEMTGTFSAIVSRLQEEHKVTIAEDSNIQDNVTRCNYSKDDDETGEPKPMDTRNSHLPDHLQRLRENHQQLTELLEARKVAAFMFQHDALTIRELQSIQQRSTPVEASEVLLEIVWDLANEVQVYECFLSALKKTNQQHIWSWLSYNDFDINCEHVQLIQNQYSFLVETIEHSGLIGLLFSRGIIDVQDKDHLETELSCLRRNEKMLSMLGRKSKQQFDLFLNCLIETGQSHVAKKLRRNLDSRVGVNDVLYDMAVSFQTAMEGSGRRIASRGASSENTEHQFTSSEVPSNSQATAQLTAGTSLSHVISPDGRGKVAGVTFCDNKLFVLQRKSEQRLEQYDIECFRRLEAIRINGLSDNDWSWCKSLTSCCINECLYVNDFRAVFRVDLSTNKVISWQVGGRPCGLSVNATGNVLVTCCDGHKIIEYTTSGSLVRSIKLKVKHMSSPVHTVQLTDGRYVVVHLGPVHDVSMIDQHGALITSYRNSETTQLVDGPRWIVVVNDCILVADVGNNRILSLDSSMNTARELSLPVDSRLSGPCRIYFDQSSGRLFVGECEGECRVLVFDRIQWT